MAGLATSVIFGCDEALATVSPESTPVLDDVTVAGPTKGSGCTLDICVAGKSCVVFKPMKSEPMTSEDPTDCTSWKAANMS